jgi:hypothetical protein
MGLTRKSRSRRRPGETRTRDRLSRYRRRSTRPWWYACRLYQPPLRDSLLQRSISRFAPCPSRASVCRPNHPAHRQRSPAGEFSQGFAAISAYI